MMRLRNYFLTGIVVTAPIAITAYLVWAFVGWVDGWVKPLIPHAYNPDNYLPFTVPGFGLIVAVVLLTLVGFLTASIVGRAVIRLGEYVLDRMPLVRSVYRGLKQIFETVLSGKSNTFKRVGLIEYPRKGMWAIVFLSTDAEGEIADTLEDKAGETAAVFLPTTPNPTSGFLLYVPKSDIIHLTMSVEDGAKLVISAGLVSPEFQARTKALAKEAGAVVETEEG